jgi:hypothetical protein
MKKKIDNGFAPDFWGVWRIIPLAAAIMLSAVS